MDIHEERNFYRLLLLLNRVGIFWLRDYFKHTWDSTKAVGQKIWTDCPQDGADLVRIWKPKVHPYEQVNVSSGDTSKWDLLLFVKILLAQERKSCVRKALEILKDLRNRLCHSSDGKISNGDFESCWSDACHSLTIFGAKLEEFQSVIKDAETSPVDLKRELDLLKDGQERLLFEQKKVGKGQIGLQQGQEEIKGMQRVTNQLLYGLLQNHHFISSASQYHDYRTTLTEDMILGYHQRQQVASLHPIPHMAGNPRFNITHMYTFLTLLDVVWSSKIFYCSRAESPSIDVYRTLIEGDPGVGKSSMCKKIAYDWSTNNSPYCHLVFLLKCRDFQTGNSLWDAIEYQNMSDDLKNKKTELINYIKSNQKKVLLLLDGYDEIPQNTTDKMKHSIKDLITGKLLPECSVIVTSRPRKGSELRRYFERKFQIQSFDLKDIVSYITRFFASEPGRATALISFIQKHKDVQDLVRTPLYIAILCQVFQENKGEEPSLSYLAKEIIFSVMKRYCIEKLEQNINDDELLSEFHEPLSILGKIAFQCIEEKKNVIEEKEYKAIIDNLGVRLDKVALMDGFLKHTIDNNIRQHSCYSFSCTLIKNQLATDYYQECRTRNRKCIPNQHMMNVLSAARDYLLKCISIFIQFLTAFIKGLLIVVKRCVRGSDGEDRNVFPV